MMKKEEMVKLWFEQAKLDYRSAQHSLYSKDYYVVGLLCQQAVEKALKYLLLKNGGALIKTHDLVHLGQLCKAPEFIISHCSYINPLYVVLRYPDDETLPSKKINKKDALLILEYAKQVLQWIEN